MDSFGYLLGFLLIILVVFWKIRHVLFMIVLAGIGLAVLKIMGLI